MKDSSFHNNVNEQQEQVVRAADFLREIRDYSLREIVDALYKIPNDIDDKKALFVGLLPVITDENRNIYKRFEILQFFRSRGFFPKLAACESFLRNDYIDPRIREGVALCVKGTLEEISAFIMDGTVSTPVRRVVMEMMDSMSWVQMRQFIAGETGESERLPLHKKDFIVQMMHKVPDITFATSHTFIADGTIDKFLRAAVVHNMQVPDDSDLPQVRALIEDEGIPEVVRTNVIRRIGKNGKEMLKGILRSSAIDDDFRFTIAEQLTYFFTGPQEVLDFVRDKAFDLTAKLVVIQYGIQERSLAHEDVQDILLEQGNSVQSSIAEAILSKVTFIPAGKDLDVYMHKFSANCLSEIVTTAIPDGDRGMTKELVNSAVLKDVAVRAITCADNGGDGERGIMLGIENTAQEVAQKIINRLPVYEDNERLRNSRRVGGTDERALSLYLRYGHTVNHGVTLDIVTRVIHEYIAKGHSQLWSKIRLVPYNAEKYPPPRSTIALSQCELYDVHGDAFEEALYDGADAVVFSHAQRTGRKRLRGNALASHSCGGDLSDCQKMPVEFEDSKVIKSANGTIDLHTAAITEIATGIIASLQEFEEALLRHKK